MCKRVFLEVGKVSFFDDFLMLKRDAIIDFGGPKPNMSKNDTFWTL